MRAADTLPLRMDRDVRDKEREESERIRRRADEAAARAAAVSAKVDRMTELYRERLQGTGRSRT